MVLLMGVLGESVQDKCSEHWEVHLHILDMCKEIFPLAGGVWLIPAHIGIGGTRPSKVAAPGGLANRLWEKLYGLRLSTQEVLMPLYLSACTGKVPLEQSNSQSVSSAKETLISFFSIPSTGLQGRVPIFVGKTESRQEYCGGEHCARWRGPGFHEAVSLCWFP